MKTTEYTVTEIRSLLEKMSGMYDLARVVDPIECRILAFESDGGISRNESCYGIWNADQRCINCSSALACRTGCHQEKAECFRDQVFHIQSNPVRLRLPDGGICDAVVELVSIEEKNTPANDRAAENTDHRAAQYLAIHDPLTGALNAGAFYEFARERIVRRPDASWVMTTANIMDFRLVNTLFGVLKGNEILVRTAELLRGVAERCDGLCGRLGNDQFALLLPRSAFREELLLQAARELSGSFSSGLYTLRIHFGVYSMEDASIPVSVMCDRANSALRTIRESLTETLARFDDSMMRRSLFEQQIISGFDRALREGQFQMYLQPLVSEDGRVYGAEALARWRRPDGTILMPGDFIETLEHAGRVHELDMYIWERAVRQLSLWTDTDKKDLLLSINMSAKDFYSVEVERVLTGLVERYGVDSRRLCLEITETALLEEPEKSGAVIARLRDRGFCVEIDDFGKGFSALRTLKDIRADVLKIDISLLHEIEQKPRSRIILESVIHMAKLLEMDVVTEGVETEGQLRSLSAMGCRHFQGFLFSRPLPVEEFERLLAPAE